eukprot:scpid75107/ scgid23912/ 
MAVGERMILGAVVLLVYSSSTSVDGKHVSSFTHGWDCIACSTNNMLAANFGDGYAENANFKMSDPWWVDVVAQGYAAVALSDFLGSQNYNGTGENGMVTVARALKAANPKIKILYYQNAEFGTPNAFHYTELEAHPEWWLRSDSGDTVWFRPPKPGYKGYPAIDLSIPAVQWWFGNLTLRYFKNQDEVRELCDGIFIDGSGYFNRYLHQNVSDERYEKLFAGKMQMMENAQNYFTQLNQGDVWGNAAMNVIWRLRGVPYPGGNLSWETDLQHFNGAFTERITGFDADGPDGNWNVTFMEMMFESIISASNAGHCVIIKSFVGPATQPFVSRGEPSNSFRISSWSGSVPVPNTTEECRQAMAERINEVVAPFLIVANEHVFFSFAWFYGIADGHIPCKAGVECGMPSEWYPEFTRPLGPPKAAATRQGTVWTREFEHASVYVDLANRSASRVTWN